MRQFSSEGMPSHPSCELCRPIVICHFPLIQGNVWIRLHLLKGPDVSRSSISFQPLVKQSTSKHFLRRKTNFNAKKGREKNKFKLRRHRSNAEDERHVCKTSRSQFHQHFTQAFLYKSVFSQLFSTFM